MSRRRKTKRGISKEKKNRFIELRRVGMNDEDACEMSGFCVRTLYDWLQSAREDPDSPHKWFARLHKEAGMTRYEKALRRIDGGLDNPDAPWQLAMAILERTRPNEYSLHPSRFAKEERERLEALGKKTEEAAATQASVEAMILDIAMDMPPAASRELLDAIRRRKEKESA